MADEHKVTSTAHETKAEAAEAKKAEAAEAKKEAAETKTTSGKLAPAGASGDPAVQKALADLYTAQQNRAALDVEEADIKAADEQVAAAEKALADLGYE
jgi:hypothetical protein